MLISPISREQASTLLAAAGSALLRCGSPRMKMTDQISPTRGGGTVQRRLQAEVRDELLQGIFRAGRKRRPRSIRELMFVFEDFLKVEPAIPHEIKWPRP